MQKVLIDGGQFVLQHEIQMLQDLWIALHDRRSSELTARDLGGAASGAQWKLEKSICGSGPKPRQDANGG